MNPGLKMSLGSSNEPCGLIEVSSIGAIGVEENKKCIAVLTDHVQQNIGIPKHKWDENKNTFRNKKVKFNYHHYVITKWVVYRYIHQSEADNLF